MEEVDNTIVRQLREIGCNIEDDVKSLRELDHREVIDCILHCFSLILPEEELPAKLKPDANMATKYNVATFLAAKCKQQGFRSDLGYQSFLYGSESDIRNVMLFLIEKLPKSFKSESELKKKITPADRFAASPELTRVWLPAFDDEVPVEDMREVPLNGILNSKSILMNRIAPNKRQFYDQFACIPFHDVYSILQTDQPVNSISASSAKHGIQILSAFPATIHSSNQTDSFVPELEPDANQTSSGVTTEVTVPVHKSAVELLESEFQLKTEAVEISKREISDLRSRIEMLEQSLREEQVNLLVLKSGQLNLDELRELERNNRQDFQDLKIKWQEMKTELEQEIESLKVPASKVEEYQKQILETKRLIGIRRRDYESKNRMLEQLKAQTPAEMPPARSFYTERILEIICNMKKQDAETAKLISEMRSLQKEISSLTGKVSRSFAVADELIFSHAKTDPFSRRAYRLLVSMYRESDKLSQLIESLGLVKREVLKLEESAQKEKALDIENKLNKISEDYYHLKQSNKQLLLQLKQESS